MATVLKLKELGKIIKGNTTRVSHLKSYSSNDINFVKPSDFLESEITYIDSSEFFISEYARYKSRIVPSGSILVTCIGNIGKVGITQKECAFNQQINAIIPDTSKVIPSFLAHILLYKKSELNNLANNAVVPIINKKEFSEFKIHIPSIKKQKKIACKLDFLKNIISLRQKQLSKLDQLVKSRFIEMFGDPLSNVKNWSIMTLSQVCHNIYGGGTPSKRHPEYFTGTIPWVSPKDMKTDIINNSIDHITNEAIINSTTNIIPIKSILMVIRSGILKHTLPVAINNIPVTINQDMKAFVPNNIIIKSEFLMYYFKSIEFDILSGVRGVTADNIDFKEFQKRKIIVPPIQLQEQFADFVQQVGKAKSSVKQSLETLETLKKSLMQEYFG